MGNEQEKHYGSFHDANTGETIMRELTPEEIAVLPVNDSKSNEEQINLRKEIKASAFAKLSALGLTEEEIKEIVGRT